MADAKAPHEMETRLRVEHYLPRLWMLNLGAVLIAGAVLLAWPSSPSNRAGWTGGPVTNHHRLIEQSCQSCHPTGFDGTPDESCMGCHNVRDHADSMLTITAQNPELANRCASCHREHHGEDNLVPPQSLLCTECHSRMQELSQDGSQPNFTSLADHPEFAVEAWSGDPPVLGRVRLGQLGIRGITQLKFSHALHLSLDSETLSCASCHDTRQATIPPISFERDCSRCHAIPFDGRAGAAQVPHLTPTRVYGFVRGEVARVQLAAAKEAVPRSRREAPAPDVESESREVEAGLFTRGGECLQCHDVHEQPDAGVDESRFRIEPPRRSRPMAAAVFDHFRHRFSPCEQCHDGIQESRSAGDILVPRITVCRDCHADPGTPGKIESPCLQCHGYHDVRRH